MWKKALPLFVLIGILLVGCTNKEAIPENNETPMEDVRDDARQLEDDFEGQDLDTGTTDDSRDNIDVEIEENIDKSQVEIIEDFNRKNDVE